MEGLTIMKYRCTDCNAWFKKSQKEAHVKATEHHVLDKGKIFQSVVPPQEPVLEVIDFKKEYIIPVPKIQEMITDYTRQWKFSFTGDVAKDYPAVVRGLRNLKTLMRVNGIIGD